MKRLIAASTLCLAACATSGKDNRQPASQPGVHIIERGLAPTDNLDERFERAWKSPQQEREALQRLATLNGGFVRSANQQYVKWSEQAAAHPNAQDRVSQVVKDFPRRENGQYGTRAVHKKNHGCYPATLQFNDQAPDKGYYRKNASYDALIRFSNGNARNLNDADLDGRGMAVKILPSGTVSNALAQGAKALNANTLLNLSHVNFPVPFMFDPAEYHEASAIGLREYTKPDPKVKPLFAQLIAGKHVSLRTRVLAGTMTTTAPLNPLYQEYHSMIAASLGSARDESRTAIKTEFAPCGGRAIGPDSPEWAWSPVRKVNVGLGLESVSGFTFLVNQGYLKFLKSPRYAQIKNEPNFLRAAAQRTLQEDGFCYDVKIQRFIDAANTPVEDPTEVWLQSEEQRKQFVDSFGRLPVNAGAGPVEPLARRKIAPSTVIAKLVIPKLDAEDIALINSPEYQKMCEDLSFNTWDNVPEEHKPLGVVSRMRWHAYGASIDSRHGINNVK